VDDEDPEAAAALAGGGDVTPELAPHADTAPASTATVKTTERR
jgi:hypothetical protein